VAALEKPLGALLIDPDRPLCGLGTIPRSKEKYLWQKAKRHSTVTRCEVQGCSGQNATPHKSTENLSMNFQQFQQ
jgi:hypothetical protein